MKIWIEQIIIKNNQIFNSLDILKWEKRNHVQNRYKNIIKKYIINND